MHGLPSNSCIMAAFLQWNCRGLLRNYDDVYSLLDQHHPIAFCLQETHLNNSHSNILRRFQVFRRDRPLLSHSSGGVAIVVQPSTPCVEVPLNTTLEAVAVRVLLDRLITVCSLYIPPSYPVSREELESLHDQLPQPALILGDFNAHNPLWGSRRRDTRGLMIERFL